MAIVSEPYVVETGMTQVFSEIENCEIIARPSKTGYYHQIKTLTQRPGLESNPTRETDDDILYGEFYSQVMYLYDDSGKVYTFDGSTLTSISTVAHTIDTNVIPHFVPIAFLGGGRFPNDTTEFTVSSYNSGTSTITVAETVLTQDYVGKYVYIVSGNLNALRQVRAVSQIISNNQIKVDQGYNVNPGAGDKIIVFNELRSQLWFPQVRKASDPDYIFALDLSGNQNYVYFPNARKMVNFDGRVFYLHKDRTNILVSQLRSYEIIDLTKLVRLTQEAYNIAIHLSYVFVFFPNSTGLLKKVVLDQTTNQVLYQYQDGINIGSFSEESFYSDGKNLYIFGDDNRLYAINVTLSSTGEVILEEQLQADNLNTYFDKFESGKVLFKYSLGVLRMVHVDDNNNITTVFKLERDEWLVDTYPNFDGNFMAFYTNIKSIDYTCYENKILRVGGLTDDGQNIIQRIKFYGPATFLDKMFTLYQIKIMLGFYGGGIGGRFRYEIGGIKKFVGEGDLKDLEFIDTINGYAEGDNTMGGQLIGDVLFGGEVGEGALPDIYSEYIWAVKKIGKQGAYYSFEMINDTKYGVMIRHFVVDMETMNTTPLSVPNKQVF